MAGEGSGCWVNDLTWKNILPSTGASTRYSAPHISRHVGQRAISISLPAGAKSVAVPPLNAGVVSRHPIVGGPVGPWLALGSPARRCDDSHRRGQHVAGPSRGRSNPYIISNKASLPPAAHRHAR